MGRLTLFLVASILLVVVIAEAAPSKPYKAKCPIKSYKRCYNVEHSCPKSCPGYCYVDCRSCKPVCSCDYPGAVCQDPKFVGGDGVTFYFHGKKERDFCLLSDSNLHINAHFIGKRNTNMKRDFTWVQAIGILFGDHQVYIGAQKTRNWDDSVDRLSLVVDGDPVYLPAGEGAKGQSPLAPAISFTRSRDANGITVEVDGLFKIEAAVVPITEEESRLHHYGVTEEDCMAHLELGFKFYSLTDSVDGVLGQTYAKDYISNVKMSAQNPIMGGDRKFSTTSIFGTDCAVARFSKGAPHIAQVNQYAGLTCGSSFNGRGIVCKK